MNITFLKQCDQEYYNTGKVLISDAEYDSLKDQLRAEYPNDPYFKTVGAPVAGSAVSLPYILGSLTKTKPDGTLLKWCIDNKVKMLALSDKLDGVSIYCKYIDGGLVQATTRGDGYEGKDITAKMKLRVPTCDAMGVQEFRGEALMTDDNCEKLGYSLPRSAVAGILNGDDQEHFDKMEYVDIVFYTPLGVTGPETWPSMWYFIEKANLPCVSYYTMNVNEDLEERLQRFYKERQEASDWAIDGMVCANLHDTTVGEDYYPDNIVAFKVNEEAVRCTVTKVVWEVKRSGKLQPVVHFHPVKIGGSMVSKATGFNRKFIKDNFIMEGAEIGIVKSGDIIPYITTCYTGFDGAITEGPTNCPSCGEYLDSSKSGVDLICINPDCSGQSLYKIEHFLLAHGVEEVTATTIKKLPVSCVEDLYSLTHDQIASIEGLGSSKAKTILEQLKKTLDTTPEKLLKSFGISGIGNSASDLIMNTYGDFDTLFSVDQDDFKKLDGVGDVLARNLFNGLTNNITLYRFLKEQGLQFEKKASADLQGKVFCLTGKSDIARNDLIQMIGSHGGMVKGISKKVDYVVTNDVNSTSGKMKKAIQYGIAIISYDELLNKIS